MVFLGGSRSSRLALPRDIRYIRRMPALPLIADLAGYRPCIQNLLTDGEDVREYWLSLFERHLEVLGDLPVGDGRLQDQPIWGAFCRDYLAGLEDIRREPGRRGRLTVLELTLYREEQFAAHGIVDPFIELKRRETDLAVGQFRAVLEDLDAAPWALRIELLARGLMAGNLFDMGSKAAVDAFSERDFDFFAARDDVRRRPWPVDNLDEWVYLWDGTTPAYRQALFFVDNAGPDIVLGGLPLARELALRGTRVVLAANSQPALNDITAAELQPLLGSCRRLDDRLDGLVRDGLISVVASGCGAPLIDLGDVSAGCAAAAAESDLLIIEGMGRAIESNYDAPFTVDAVKLALIKDKMVARVLGVELFSPVFRFEPAPVLVKPFAGSSKRSAP